MNGTDPADHVYFAARRPDWQLPQIHQGLQLSSFEALEQHNDRQTCSKCGRSRSWYCYDCLQPFTPAPRLQLPFQVTIITHQQEPASKNTGVQAAILAPDHVDLHRMTDLPAFDPSRCLVLYPSTDALTPQQLEGSAQDIERVFIIDSKWKKASELVKSPVFAGVRHVKLADKRSAFWRFHTKGVTDEGVCTVEALFFLLKELQEAGKLASSSAMQGEHYFDDLLWYFAYQHMFIQQRQGIKHEQRAARLQAQAANGRKQRRPKQQGKQQQQGQQQEEGQQRAGEQSQASPLTGQDVHADDQGDVQQAGKQLELQPDRQTQECSAAVGAAEAGVRREDGGSAESEQDVHQSKKPRHV